jgi:hypothetical protein
LTAGVCEAGFSDVSVVRQELIIKIPMAAEFVPLHLGSMPIADAFHDLPDNKKDALIDTVADALKDHVEGNQIVYLDAVNVVMGRK